MASAEVTPLKPIRKRALFAIPVSPASMNSSPDRYSSPPTTPQWIMETPPKITGSLLKSPTSYFDLVANATTVTKPVSFENNQPLKSKQNLQTQYESCHNSEEAGDNSFNEANHLEDVERMREPWTPKKPKFKRIATPFQNDSPEKTQFSIKPNSFYKNKSEKLPECGTYSMMGSIKRKRSPGSKSVKVFRSISTGRKSHTVSRRLPKRSRYGEINAGVWHGVKKPRPKKKKHDRQFLKIPKIVPVDRIQKYIKENDKSNSDSTQESVNMLSKISLQSPKRAPSPPPDPSKKFFKTNRTMHINKKATVTIENNIQVEVRNGKLKLPVKEIVHVQKVKGPSLPKAEFEPMETDDVLQSSVCESVNKILGNLEMDSMENNMPLPNSTTSNNSVASQNDQPKINSEVIPTEIVTLSEPLKTFVPQATAPAQQFYPLFCNPPKNDTLNRVYSNKKIRKTKKWIPIGDDQYQIDAGQKRFGAVQCKDCGIVYQRGDPEDEIYHEKYHSNAPTLKYLGWKDERLVRMYENGKVIVVYPDDPKSWIKKVESVMDVVNKDLGYVEMIDFNHKYLENSKVYLYINRRRIVGVLVAEPKTSAYKMLSTEVEGVDCCSAETYPVRCGVSHIWTSPDFRRKLVATRLLDCMRLRFMFDHILQIDEFSFSVPTEAGKAFAEKYTGTVNYLVYT